MATKKARTSKKVETTFPKGGAIAKRASKIYEGWKKEYREDFKAAHGDAKKIKAAAQKYRKEHGASARKRWGNAMKAAKKHGAARQMALAL